MVLVCFLQPHQEAPNARDHRGALHRITHGLTPALDGSRFSGTASAGGPEFHPPALLPFVVVLFFLLNLVKRALQDELDAFFNPDSGAAVAARTVTKSALCQARLKLKAEAFVELQQVQVAYFYTQYAPPTWHGFRLLAADGSTAHLPATPAIETHFGRWGTVPLARISQMFDTLNKITIDALIGPPAQGEREYAAQHFAHIGSR